MKVTLLLNTHRRAGIWSLTALTAVNMYDGMWYLWYKRCLLTSIYLSPAVYLSVPFWLSVSYLSSLCHLCISLLLFCSLPSDRSWQLPSGLFQAPAHTRVPSSAIFPSHTFALFATIPRNFSVLLFESFWAYLPAGDYVSKLDLHLKALALASTRPGGGPKQAGIRVFASSSLPVHLVFNSRGADFSVFMWPPWTSASLSMYGSFIYNEVSSLPVPVAAQISCLWHAVAVTSNMPACLVVHLSLFLAKFKHLSSHLPCPACQSSIKIDHPPNN